MGKRTSWFPSRSRCWRFCRFPKFSGSSVNLFLLRSIFTRWVSEGKLSCNTKQNIHKLFIILYHDQFTGGFFLFSKNTVLTGREVNWLQDKSRRVAFGIAAYKLKCYCQQMMIHKCIAIEYLINNHVNLSTYQ